MNLGERADGPAVEAEVQPSNANPLLPLVSLDVHDQSTLIDELRQLPAGPATAKWVDALLDDPRLGAMPNVREVAVQTLLEFGHPYALLINPEHLAEYRRKNPSDLRPWRMFAGAALGCVASTLGFLQLADQPMFTRGAHPALLEMLVFALGIAWTFTVAVRALWTRRLTRVQVIGEVLVGLALSAAASWIQNPGFTHGVPPFGAAMLAAILPVALAGLAGGWSER